MIEFLAARGTAHAEHQAKHEDVHPPSAELLREAAEALVDERAFFSNQRLPVPGQAEYLDLIRVLCRRRGQRCRAARPAQEGGALHIEEAYAG